MRIYVEYAKSIRCLLGLHECSPWAMSVSGPDWQVRVCRRPGCEWWQARRTPQRARKIDA